LRAVAIQSTSAKRLTRITHARHGDGASAGYIIQRVERALNIIDAPDFERSHRRTLQ
jgi:hypothetical protein